MTPISKELERAINQEATKYAATKRSNSLAESFCREIGYKDGATAYAHYKERCEELERWKREADSLLSPLLDYGQSKEANIPLGASISAVILQRAKQYEQAKDALEDIMNGALPTNENEMVSWIATARDICRKALASWKEEGKEVGNDTGSKKTNAAIPFMAGWSFR